MNNEPQSWDTRKVRVAFEQIQGLAVALGNDTTGKGFRKEIERVGDEAFPDGTPMTQKEIDNRLSYLLYGAAVFGFTALTAATELSGKSQQKSQQEVLEICRKTLDVWLQRNLSF